MIRRSHAVRGGRQLFRYPIYRRMLISFGMLVIALVLAIALLLGHIHTMISMNQMQAYSQVMMSQRVYSTDLLWEEMEALASAIYSNADAQAYLNMREEDKVIKYHAGLMLTRFKALYSFVQNISLIHTQLGVSVSTLNYGDNAGFFIANADNAGIRWIPREIEAQSRRYAPIDVVSMLVPFRIDASGVIQCGIMVDIDQNHIQSLLQFTDVVPGARTLILDRTGSVVSSTSEDSFMASYASDGTVEQILASQEKAGSLLEQSGHEKRLVTWQHLEANGWTVVSFLPTEALTGRFSNVVSLVMLGLAALLIIALTAVFLSSRSVYRPIQNLVDRVIDEGDGLREGNEIDAIAHKINMIQQDSADMKKTMHLTMVQNLLFGIPVSLENRQTPLKGAAAYCVVTLKIMGLEEGESRNDQMIVAAGNLAAMLVQEICPCETAAWANNAVLILCLEEKELPQSIPVVLEQACASVREHLHLQAVASVSGPVYNPEQIHQAYSEAQTISQFTFYSAEVHVLTGSHIAAWTHPSPVNTETWGQRFAAGILDGDRQEILKNTRTLMDLLMQRPPRMAKQLACNVLESLMERFEHHLPEQTVSEMNALRASIEKAASFDDVRMLFQTCLDGCFQSAADGGARVRNQKLIQELCVLVETRYADPDLNLQTAADAVGLSAGYLGRMFKALERETFTEYVTRVRLTKARELLSETSMPVSAVAHAVGMDNQSYFSSLFRKAFGTSPSTFRQTRPGGGERENRVDGG